MNTLFPDKALAVLAVHAGASQDRQTRADRIFEGLSQAILAGYLAPGSKLPSEQAMAQHFEVSRPVLRQALHKLRGAELLASRRGSGSYVRAPSLAALSEPSHSQDISHILHGVELRLLIEPEAAALAAMRRTPEDIAHMARTVEAFAQATEAGEPTHAHDYGFHEAIARATANPRLLQAIQALEFDVSHAVKVWRHLARMNPEMRLRDAVEEHRAILECVRAEDAEGARRAMRGHIEKARVRMMSRG